MWDECIKTYMGVKEGLQIDGSSKFDEGTLEPLVLALSEGTTTLLDLTQRLGLDLTGEDGVTRRRATSLLALLLELLSVKEAGSGYFGTRAHQVGVLLDFFLARFSDYPSLLPSIRAICALLRVIEHLPGPHLAAAVPVSRVLFKELTVQAADQGTRSAVYSLLLTLVSSPVYSAELLKPGEDGGVSFALDFVAGFITAMDGEKDPRSLLVCLKVAHLLLLPGFGEATVSLAPEIFSVTSCYFPITFTPPPNDPYGITSDMLADSLLSVFTASPVLAPHVVELLLEKLSSSLSESKRASMKALSACAPVYGLVGLQNHLVDIASSLRGEVLRPRDTTHTTRNLAQPPSQISTKSPWASVGNRGMVLATGIQCPPFSEEGPHFGNFEGVPSDHSAHKTEKPTIPEEALRAIVSISRVLSVEAARNVSVKTPQFWTDWVGLLVHSSSAEFERAPDSTTGRACSQILVAVASASHFSLSHVLSSVIPLCSDLFIDAVTNRRPAVGLRVVTLLAGLVSSVDSGIDHPSGLHPLSPHVPAILKCLTGILGWENGALEGGEGYVGDRSVTLSPVSLTSQTPTEVPPANPSMRAMDTSEESKCLAVLGLCDLCIRSPSPLLAAPQVSALVFRLSRECCSSHNGPSPHLFRAAAFTLSYLAEKGGIFEDAVISVSLPFFLGIIRDSMEATTTAFNYKPEQGVACDELHEGLPSAPYWAIRSLGHIACASSMRVWRALFPALFNLIVSSSPDISNGEGGGEVGLRTCNGAPSPTAISVLKCVASALIIKALPRGSEEQVNSSGAAKSSSPVTAALDALAGVLSSSNSCVDDSTTSFSSPGVSLTPPLPSAPSPLITLLNIALNSDSNFSPKIESSIMTILRLMSTRASPAVQEGLSQGCANLLLGLPVDEREEKIVGLGGESDRWSLPGTFVLSFQKRASPPPLCPGGGKSSSALPSLPIFLAPLACSRPGSPLIPQSAALVDALTSFVLSGEADYASLRSAAQCIGSILNRGVGKVAQLTEVMTSIKSASSRKLAVLLALWVYKGLAQRSFSGASQFLDFVLGVLEENGVGGATKVQSLRDDPGLVSSIAEGLGEIVAPPPQFHPFSPESGCSTPGTFMQRLLVTLLQRLKPMVNCHSSPIPLLLSICSVMTHLPKPILLSQATAISGVVVQTLELTAPSEESSGLQVAETAVIYSSIMDSVRVSALRGLSALLENSPTTIAPHVLTLAPRLVALTQAQLDGKGCRPLVRALAVESLLELVKRLPFHQVHPIRPVVVKGLLPALDDNKQAVRRRAGACRNAWML